MFAAVVIPGMRLKTPGNSGHGRGGHWAVYARYVKEQRQAALLHCRALGTEVRDRLLALPRLRLHVVRLGGRRMDPPNVLGACKGLVDGVADWLGVDDKDPWYEWTIPGQVNGGDYAVRIEFSRGEVSGEGQ